MSGSHNALSTAGDLSDVSPQASSSAAAQASRKTHPKLLLLQRVITANKAFYCLIDNFDVFKVDDYRNSALLMSVIDPAFYGLVDLLQVRENGGNYSMEKVLENAGDTLVKAMNTGLPTARKGGILLEALRPYLLLDRWITAFRTDVSTLQERPVVPLHALEMADLNEKVRKAMHKSYVTTMRNLTPTTPTLSEPSTQSQPSEGAHNIFNLIQRGIGARRQSKISVAEYRFTAMAVVVALFTQRVLSNEDIDAEASKLFTHVPQAEWKAVIRDGLSWLGMALLTTLKDALVFPPHEPPSTRFLFFIGNRYRQQPPSHDFLKLEKSLWMHMFKTCLNMTNESLESFIGNLGVLAEAERPDSVNLTVVPLLEQIQPCSGSQKRKRLPLSSEEGASMQKRLREGSEELDGSDSAQEDDEADAMQVDQPSEESLTHGMDGGGSNLPHTDVGRDKDGDCAMASNSALVGEGGTGSGVSVPTPCDTTKTIEGFTSQPDGCEGADTEAANGESDGCEDKGGEVARPIPSLESSDDVLEVSTSDKLTTGGRQANRRGRTVLSDKLPASEDVAGKNVGGHILRKNTFNNSKADDAYKGLASRANTRKNRRPPAIKKELHGIYEVLQFLDYEEIKPCDLEEKIKVEEDDDLDYYPTSIVRASKAPDERQPTPSTGRKVNEGSLEEQSSEEEDDGEESVTKKWKLREDATEPSEPDIVSMVIDARELTIRTWYSGDFQQLTQFNAIFERMKRAKSTPKFVCALEYDKFKDLPASDVWEKMKTQHLLVRNCPPVISVGDLERRLGMNRTVEIQDLWYRRKGQIPCHSLGTLASMQRCMRQNATRPMNALDLPCGHIKIDTPRLLDISFRDTVWSALRHVDRPTFEETMPMDDFRWALHSSTNAYSTPHIDSNGLWTVIAPVNCTKLWILGKPKKEDLMDTRAFSTFEMYELKLQDYDWEPLLIVPGDMLYMRPGTVHAVVTIDPGFTIGEHFFTMGTLTDSLASMFHLSAKDSFLTNASHNLAVAKTLCRLMHCWRLRLSHGIVDEDLPKLDLARAHDLKALVMLGAYIHLVIHMEEKDDRKLTHAETKLLGIANEDNKILYSYFNQHYAVKRLRYKKFLFPNDNKEDKEILRDEIALDNPADCALDMIFRNGWMWIIANVWVFFHQVDVTAESVASLKRLDAIVTELVKRYKVDRVWFDRIVAWLKKNFKTSRMDEWIDWESLEILEKRKPDPVQPVSSTPLSPSADNSSPLSPMSHTSSLLSSDEE